MSHLPPALVAMLPDVGAAVKGGDLSVETAGEAWVGISRQFNPKPLLVVLYGSVVTGTAKPFSDIDLLLVCENGDHVVRRHVAANGFLFDITIFPRRLARNVAMDASRSLGPGRIMAFVNGIPIDGDHDLFDEMRAEMLGIYASKSQNQPFLLASMERNLLAMLVDSCCVDSIDIARCTIQEAKFVALNILSVREFGELLPPSIMLSRADQPLRAMLLAILDYPISEPSAFAEFIVDSVGFCEIKCWEV